MDRLIKVREGNDPLLTIRLKQRNPDGTFSPYILTAASIEFIVKADPDNTDVVGAGGAKFNYSTTGGQIAIVDDGASIGDEFSVLTVQCAALDLVAGIDYYKLNVEKGGRKETVMFGPFEVENV